MRETSEPPSDDQPPSRPSNSTDKRPRRDYDRAYKKKWWASLPEEVRLQLRREEGHERRLIEFAPLVFHFPDGTTSQARLVRSRGGVVLRPSRTQLPRTRWGYFGARLSEPFSEATIARLDVVSVARDTLNGVPMDGYDRTGLEAHALGLTLLTWAYFAHIVRSASSEDGQGDAPTTLREFHRSGWKTLARWTNLVDTDPLYLLWALAGNDREIGLVSRSLAATPPTMLPLFRYHAALATCVGEQFAQSIRISEVSDEAKGLLYLPGFRRRICLPAAMSKSLLTDAWERALSIGI